MKASTSADASLRYLLVPSITACVIIVLVLFALNRIGEVLSTLAFVLLSLAVAAGFACEALVWLQFGVRRIEVDERSLTLYRGRALRQRSVERISVRSVRVVSRLGRRSATLYLGRGRWLRVASSAFPAEAFTAILDAIAEWSPTKPPPR